jgi:hypothetical protein
MSKTLPALILTPVRLLQTSLATLGFLLSLPAIQAQEVQDEKRPPAMVNMSPGVYQLGKMRLDKGARSLSFPATVNMEDGPIEYLLVAAHGSTHESLLCTDVHASDIHFAMLLLGAKGASATNPQTGQPPSATRIDSDSLRNAPKPQGDSIQIIVKWREANQEKTAHIEDWLFNSDTQKAAERGPWIYSGSMLLGSTFLAQAEGNLAAVVLNSSSLINNPRSGNNNDKIWFVHKDVVARQGSVVELTISLSNPIPSK